MDPDVAHPPHQSNQTVRNRGEEEGELGVRGVTGGVREGGGEGGRTWGESFPPGCSIF